MEIHEIKNRLKAAGRTQSELADYLGISKSHTSFLLNGQKRMALDTFRKIEAYLAKAEGNELARGVAETTIPFEHPPRFTTLEEARKPSTAKPMSQEERDLIIREIRELGRAAKHLPRVTAMSDDEILGYD